MDMATTSHEQRVFFATGARQGEGVENIAGRGLRPAFFAGYQDLARLRHDFPVVLLTGKDGPSAVRPLSAIVDELLRDVAPQGIAGERLRKHALALERAVRTRVAAGATGPLSALWAAAAEGAGPADYETAQEVERFITAALKVDGEVVGCNGAMPARFLAHCWEIAHAAKARAFRQMVDRLVVRLTDILRAAFIHSAAGQQPDALRAAVGGSHQNMFDFGAMSRLVSRRAPQDELSATRRRRIEGALAVLRFQRFYADPKAAPSADAIVPFGFEFSDCASAAEAFRARLPALVETVLALSVGELEADGRYDEREHDPLFQTFGEHTLTAEDLALFPDYFVCIPPDRNAAPENANLIEMLSSGMPVKVLVETRDLLEESAVGAGHFAFGVRSVRLGMTAMGLGGVFVVQSPGSNLPCLTGPIARGFAHRGPSLFSVYSGADDAAATLPPYLSSAAANESRAFPPFSYNPLAGDNLAARFSLENCPQPEADWPVEELEYADENWQRMRVPVAFTFADFVLCDPRSAGHFACVPKDRWNDRMRPVAEWLALPEKETADCVPYLWAIDADNVLHRVLVDMQLIGAVRRCLTLWHRLREQGGIHNSHAEQLLAREKVAWEADKQKELAALKAAMAATPAGEVPPPTAEPKAAAAAPAAPAAAATEAQAPARSPDETWIETARCPSCNECQLINDKMFLYNENKQAYIGDLKAGTYRQLVEAAESCQVSIIHPGKPINPNEPGLPELLERAKAFQ
jgi:hypothetical protein